MGKESRELTSWHDTYVGPASALRTARQGSLANLGRLQAIVSQVDDAPYDQVGMLRARGISWTRIGEALGVSKQAAWERFSGED